MKDDHPVVWKLIDPFEPTAEEIELIGLGLMRLRYMTLDELAALYGDDIETDK